MLDQPIDNDDLIRKTLARNALREAEELTGKDYTDKDTTGLGLLLHLQASAEKRFVMEASGDTAFRNTVKRYLRVAGEEGFSVVLEEKFKNDRDTECTYYIMWHPDGILLSFDTFSWPGEEQNINGGNFYYNWKPKLNNTYWGVTRSGHIAANGTWVGYHDCREGLRFHLRQLRECGDFVVPWVEDPHLWLMHYMNTSSVESEHYAISSLKHAEFTEKNIKLLPGYVQKAIGRK